jgi:hypothetical protein
MCGRAYQMKNAGDDEEHMNNLLIIAVRRNDQSSHGQVITDRTGLADARPLSISRDKAMRLAMNFR